MLKAFVIGAVILSILQPAGAAPTQASDWGRLGPQLKLGPGTTPGIATDRFGSIHVVYMSKGGTWYRKGNARMRFGPPEQIPSPAGSGNYNSPCVVADTNGVPHLVFQKDGAGESTKAWYTNRIGGRWKTPIAAIDNGEERINYPRLTVHGCFAFVTGFGAPANQLKHEGTLVRISNLASGPKVDMTTTTLLWVPHPLFDRSGRLFVVGRNRAAGHYLFGYDLNLRPTGLTRKISEKTEGKTGEETGAAIDRNGVIHAAGIEGTTGADGKEPYHEQIWYNNTRRLDQGKGSILGYDGTQPWASIPVFPVLCADAQGRIYMAWRHFETGQGRITVLSGDSFAVPIAYAPAVTRYMRWNPQLAPAPKGGVYVAWDEGGTVCIRSIGVPASGKK